MKPTRRSTAPVGKSYFAKGHVSHDTAEWVGPELEATAAMTDAEVVEYAYREPDSRIRAYLQWNNQLAGAAYRQAQVRQLRQFVWFREVEASGRVRESRCVYRVKVTTVDPSDKRTDRSGRVAMRGIIYSEVVENEPAREEIIGYAKQYLRQFRKKYLHERELLAASDPEFDTLFATIDRIVDRSMVEPTEAAVAA